MSKQVYSFEGNNEVEVCRTAFLNMHDVSVKRVRNALGYVTASGTLKPDNRGRSTFQVRCLRIP